MNLEFWDGVIISSMFWYIIAAICLVRGLWVGLISDDIANWSQGYEEGWKVALKIYMPEIYEKEYGMDI